MRRLTLILGIAIGMLLILFAFSTHAQNNSTMRPMKLNAGIVTDKLKETKAFYIKTLNFGITFENDFYVLMHTPDKQYEISFLLPNHPTQRPIFQKAFQGKGMYLTIHVDNVDEEYKRIQALKIPIEIELRNEPWGDRHFAIVDPNGIGIDIVTYTSSE